MAARQLWQFDYPTAAVGAITATSIISAPVVLPYNQSPQLNIIVNEAIGGSRQTAELGAERDTFMMNFPFMNQNDYEDIKNFLETSTVGTWGANYTGASNPQTGGSGFMLRPFIFTDLSTSRALDVYLNAPPVYNALKGKRWNVVLELIEEI